MDKFLGVLGIAKKANKITFGNEYCLEAVKFKKAKAVFCAADFSKRQIQSFKDLCAKNEIEFYITDYTMEQLGASIGYAPVGVVCVLNKGLAKSAVEKLNTVSAAD